MDIERCANKNVFVDNYLIDQYSFPAKNLSDLNIHGHYSFGNLFEGNYVEKIEGLIDKIHKEDGNKTNE